MQTTVPVHPDQPLVVRPGAIVALVFGLIGVVTGWLAPARLRRMAGG